MKKGTVFIIAGVGAVALYFLSRVKASQTLKVYFDTIKIGKIKGISIPDIFAKFRIVNPSNTPLSVSAIAGDIYINDSQVADVQQTESLVIPARQEVSYSVKIKVNAIQTVFSLISFLKKKQKVKITFDGTINSTGVMIPVKQTIYAS